MKMVLASLNGGKYREAKDFFAKRGVELLFGKDFKAPLDVCENGSSYEENALIKASAWALATGLPALADDSGLEVASLNGSPGIRSARVAPSDTERVQWLLSAMKDKKERKARFVCSVAVVFPSGENGTVKKYYGVTETCEGVVAYEASGTSGFGYDPVFTPEGYDETFACLGEEIKNKISHRAKALKSIAKILSSVI